MTAIYNEFDAYPAQWIRNLIAAGHVAPGVVDERSIADLRAADVAGTGQRHFFAGIGGWSYALRLAGVPDDASIWTASCPCQPFSGAGRRRGTSDERHLWPVLRDLVEECRPPILLGEQVASGDGRAWFAAVRADLEALGYAVVAADLCAAGVGAPHIRQRLYFVAYADGVDGRLHVPGWESRRGDAQARGRGETGDVAYSDCEGPQDWRQRLPVVDGGAAGKLAHAGRDERGPRRAGQADGGALEPAGRGYARGLGDSGSARGWRDAGADARAEAASEESRLGARGVGDEPVTPGADGGMADAGQEQRRPTAPCGSDREDPPFRREGSLHDQSRSGDHEPGDPWGDAEWIACSDGKSRPAQPGSFPLAHGVPGRVGKLRAYGNAIVPQVAAAFIRASLEALAVMP